MRSQGASFSTDDDGWEDVPASKATVATQTDSTPTAPTQTNLAPTTSAATQTDLPDQRLTAVVNRLETLAEKFSGIANAAQLEAANQRIEELEKRLREKEVALGDSRRHCHEVQVENNELKAQAQVRAADVRQLDRQVKELADSNKFHSERRQDLVAQVHTLEQELKQLRFQLGGQVPRSLSIWAGGQSPRVDAHAEASSASRPRPGGTS